MIQLLPDMVINRLKAGEVVERPASVIKELVENSLDAHATRISIDIHDGGKLLIIIQDDGDGIAMSDSEMVLHRYATSKITSDEELDTL
jgi:DNA mismatch repair protein MutL